MWRLGLLVALTAGCDGVFGLVHLGAPPDTPADSSCVPEMLDTFDGRLVPDLRTWNIERSGAGTTLNPSIDADQLLLPMPSSAVGRVSLVTRLSYDLTDRAIEVELVRPPKLVAGTDSELYVHTGDHVFWIAIGVWNGALSFDTSALPPAQTTAYDAAAHRWLRMRHEPAPTAPLIVFETSQDGQLWVEGPKLALDFALTTMFVELYAKNETAVADPGEARYDNVRFMPRCP